jgi:hypothetical protein
MDECKKPEFLPNLPPSPASLHTVFQEVSPPLAPWEKQTLPLVYRTIKTPKKLNMKPTLSNLHSTFKFPIGEAFKKLYHLGPTSKNSDLNDQRERLGHLLFFFQVTPSPTKWFLCAVMIKICTKKFWNDSFKNTNVQEYVWLACELPCKLVALIQPNDCFCLGLDFCVCVCVCVWDWGLNSSLHKAGTLLLEQHPLSILLRVFWRWGVSRTICTGWPQTMSLLISDSQVARITGSDCFGKESFFFFL